MINNSHNIIPIIDVLDKYNTAPNFETAMLIPIHRVTQAQN